MDIRLASLYQGAQEAAGTVVIIDVFRAFTTAAVAFARGAARIILVATAAEALDIRRRGLSDLCIGEVEGQKPPGFDFGNSPYELSQADVAGATLVQATSAGTVGVSAAARADTIYLGAFITAAATVRAIRKRQPPLVTLVAMGHAGRQRTDEDEQCALYLRNLLQGRQPAPEAVTTLVLAGAEAQKYDDPAQPHFHPQDRALALAIDRYAFAMPVRREHGFLVAAREPA